MVDFICLHPSAVYSESHTTPVLIYLSPSDDRRVCARCIICGRKSSSCLVPTSRITTRNGVSPSCFTLSFGQMISPGRLCVGICVFAPARGTKRADNSPRLAHHTQSRRDDDAVDMYMYIRVYTAKHLDLSNTVKLSSNL